MGQHIGHGELGGRRLIGRQGRCGLPAGRCGGCAPGQVGCELVHELGQARQPYLGGRTVLRLLVQGEHDGRLQVFDALEGWLDQIQAQRLLDGLTLERHQRLAGAEGWLARRQGPGHQGGRVDIRADRRGVALADLRRHELGLAVESLCCGPGRVGRLQPPPAKTGHTDRPVQVVALKHDAMWPQIQVLHAGDASGDQGPPKGRAEVQQGRHVRAGSLGQQRAKQSTIAFRSQPDLTLVPTPLRGQQDVIALPDERVVGHDLVEGRVIDAQPGVDQQQQACGTVGLVHSTLHETQLAGLECGLHDKAFGDAGVAHRICTSWITPTGRWGRVRGRNTGEPS